ncbi:MAG: hypothetical protein AAF211_21240 [Myxococcota bacterium]
MAQGADGLVIPRVVAMYGGWLPRLFGFLGAGYVAVFASIFFVPTPLVAPAMLLSFVFLLVASVVASRLVGQSMRIGMFDLQLGDRRISAGDIVDCRIERSAWLWVVRLETRERVYHLLANQPGRGVNRAVLRWLVLQVRDLMDRWKEREGEVPDEMAELAGRAARRATSRVEDR